MKLSLLLAATSLVFVFGMSPARAQAPAATLDPQMQALLEMLQASLREAANEEPTPALPERPAVAATAAPATASKTTAQPAPAMRPPLGSASSLRTSGLAAGHLGGASLAPSSSVNGSGAAGGAARLSLEEWRLLFSNITARR